MEKIIHDLRKQIPSFKCKEGCHDCCGVVPWSKWEWEQIEEKRLQIGVNCPYASKDGCQCYEDRPIICRLFGTVKKMQCPHNCRPVSLLSENKEKEIMDKYYLTFERT